MREHLKKFLFTSESGRMAGLRSADKKQEKEALERATYEPAALKPGTIYALRRLRRVRLQLNALDDEIFHAIKKAPAKLERLVTCAAKLNDVEADLSGRKRGSKLIADTPLNTPDIEPLPPGK